MPITISRTPGGPIVAPPIPTAAREKLWAEVLRAWCRQHPEQLLAETEGGAGNE